MKGAIDGEASINRKFMETVKLINVYCNHFPKHEKYALANRIRNTAYEIYDLITEGQKRYLKKTSLSRLDIAHEQLRMQLYLAYELGYFRYKNSKEAGKDPNALEGHRKVIVSYLSGLLALSLSKWTILKIKEGINFVGYRTYKSYRLIRHYSLCKFKRALVKGKSEVITSLLGHAKNTASQPSMINLMEAQYA